MCGCLRELDAVMTPWHKNLLLGLFYNDSCQYINGLQVRIDIKKRIDFGITLLRQAAYDGFGTFMRLNRSLGDA